jgi:hypothetical protein
MEMRVTSRQPVSSSEAVKMLEGFLAAHEPGADENAAADSDAIVLGEQADAPAGRASAPETKTVTTLKDDVALQLRTVLESLNKAAR